MQHQESISAPGRTIPWRNGLQVIGVGLGAMTVEVAFSKFREWALFVPDSGGETGSDMAFPGWLENSEPDRPAFLTHSLGGHKDYLHYMCTHNPVLMKALHSAFSDLTSDTGDKPTLTGTVRQHITYAREALRGLSVLPEDIMHVAFFTLAAVHSNYFRNSDIRDSFHVDFDMPEEDSGGIFDIGLHTRHLAKVFPDDPDDAIDHIMHWAGFMFIAHEYWYAETWELDEAKRIPNIARVLADTGQNAGQDAMNVASEGGLALKYMETAKWIHEMRKQKRFINPSKSGGFLEGDNTKDFRSNELGVLFAALFFKTDLTEFQMESIVRVLDDPDAFLKAAHRVP